MKYTRQSRNVNQFAQSPKFLILSDTGQNLLTVVEVCSNEGKKNQTYLIIF